MKNFLRCCVIAYELIVLAVILATMTIIFDRSEFVTRAKRYATRIEEIIIGIEEFLDKPFETWAEFQQQGRDLIVFTMYTIYE